MVIVEFLRAWTHTLDLRGDVTRSFPQHWRGEVGVDVAAAAIVAGVARPISDETPELASAIADLLAAKPQAPTPDQVGFVATIRAEAAAIVQATDAEIIAAYQPPAASEAPAVPAAAAVKPPAARAPRAPRKGRT
jgi:hypothetical protein